MCHITFPYGMQLKESGNDSEEEENRSSEEEEERKLPYQEEIDPPL